MMQLFRVQELAPPPEVKAELPVNVQLFSAEPNAPPPEPERAELPVNVQLSSLEPKAAPAKANAELPANEQFSTEPDTDEHQTPPPLCSWFWSPAALVAPLVSVKPARVAPL